MADDTGDAAEIRTFLIADVRGYTRYTQEHGDEAAAQLAARFADIVAEMVTGRDGRVVELRGDEALCVFGSPRGALRAAVDLQRRCADELREDPSLPLRVGVGIDAGEAVAVAGGYRGGALNLAARLCSIAGPGEVLVSEGIVHLARHVDEMSYVDRGRVVLKGMDEPVHVMQVKFELDMPEAAGVAVRRWTRERLAALAAGVIVVAALVVVAAVRIGGHAPMSLRTNVVGFADASGRILGQVPLRGRPGGLAVGAGSVWATNAERDSVAQIDPAGRVVDTIPVGVGPTGVAVGGGGVWVADSGGGTVSWINARDPLSGATRITVGQGPGPIAYGESAAWVVNTTDGTLQKIDPDLKPKGTPIAIGGAPTAVAVGGGWVWVTDTSSSSVVKVDPRTLRVVERLPVGNNPVAVAFGAHRVWVANEADGTVTSIDPATDQARQIPVGRDPAGVAYANGAVWVAVGQPPSLVRIDARSLGVDATSPTDSVPQAVAASADRTWLTALAPPASHRGGTLTIVARNAVFGGIVPPDPARPIFVGHWQVLDVTNDGLLTYRRVGGPAGAQVVPDLATSMPTVSDDGRTYTFHLRRGIQYSNGQQVRASDFRYAVERQFRGNAKAPAPWLLARHVAFSGLVGYSACEDAPTTCSLAEAIQAEDRSGTITIHLSQPDPALPQKLATTAAALIPPGSPPPGSGKPVPATGPYMISSYPTKRGLLLVRNPYFHQWSADAQPAGYPDKLLWTYVKDESSELTAVEQGTADTMVDTPPPERVAELQTRYAALAHPYDSNTPATDWVELNTRAPPFDQLDVRRALNFALDRDRAVKLLGGSQLRAPTCQVLPPGIPGYTPYCPYTANPTPSGVWSAPDMARAQQLTRASGTRGTPVTIWARAGQHPSEVGMARYLATVLRQIGYPTSVHVANTIDFFDTVYPAKGVGVQVSLAGGWIADYPSPIDFFDTFLRCGVNPADRFCDPHLDSLVRDAEAAQATDPTRAVQLWQRADREAVDQAPWVPLTNTLGLDVVSARVGNYQHNPHWGILLDQLWVH